MDEFICSCKSSKNFYVNKRRIFRETDADFVPFFGGYLNLRFQKMSNFAVESNSNFLWHEQKKVYKNTQNKIYKIAITAYLKVILPH